MKRSELLTPVPIGVLTVIRPEPPFGMLDMMLVGTEETTSERSELTFSLLLERTVSKLVPEIVRPVPGTPMVGVNPPIVGAPDAFIETVKGALLVADPAGVVTTSGPVVAPDGTLVTICVAVAEETVAVTPLKVTVF
jgi:hypothetical protein